MDSTSYISIGATLAAAAAIATTYHFIGKAGETSSTQPKPQNVVPGTFATEEELATTGQDESTPSSSKKKPKKKPKKLKDINTQEAQKKAAEPQAVKSPLSGVPIAKTVREQQQSPRPPVEVQEEADSDADSETINGTPKKPLQGIQGSIVLEDEDDLMMDSDGWAQVPISKSIRARTPLRSNDSSATYKSTSTPAATGKNAKKNSNKKAAANAAKQDASREQAERLAAHRRLLAQHERELAHTKQLEQKAGGKGKLVSGGMKASVDENGALVWN